MVVEEEFGVEQLSSPLKAGFEGGIHGICELFELKSNEVFGMLFFCGY